MMIVKMLKNGEEVSRGYNADEDAARNDAIRNYYVKGDHGLSHDDLWDRIEEGEFEFIITQFGN